MFHSLQRHYRGFVFNVGYETKENFNRAMKEEYEGNSEICWAYLYSDSGKLIAEYRRGYTMAEYTGLSD